jgi:deazaflavin-dependent oxidoreductase (nitroreductase family)
MSGSVLLLTFKGRNSGKSYTTPVSYVRDSEDLLLVSRRDRSWWKNLRGAKVTLRIRGREQEGVAEACEGGLLALLRSVPAYRRYLNIEPDPDGRPKVPDDLARVAEGNVLVRVGGLTEIGGA